MPKRPSQPTRTGQLAGARIKIDAVYNNGLREYVAIVNQGTVAQPLSGWALVALRGNRFYFFPDDLILIPGMKVFIHSGQEAVSKPPAHLFWTDEQMWSNRNDVALLFDHGGIEIDRCAYSHKRMLGNEASRRKRLLNDGETWYLANAPLRKNRKLVRQPKEKARQRRAVR